MRPEQPRRRQSRTSGQLDMMPYEAARVEVRTDTAADVSDALITFFGQDTKTIKDEVNLHWQCGQKALRGGRIAIWLLE